MSPSWLLGFIGSSAKTDKLVGRSDHVMGIATGLVGESAGVLVEYKKRIREGDAYPITDEGLKEELGDALWYFVRLVDILEFAPESVCEEEPKRSTALHANPLHEAVALNAASVRVLEAISADYPQENRRELLISVWRCINAVASTSGLSLESIGEENVLKRESRWPTAENYVALFDADFPEEEQLPKYLEVEFRKPAGAPENEIILRCNGLNLGDRLTDNIGDSDDYRFHDIFHFAYAVYLGWSPVLRDLLRCKRKSDSIVDENEDGARAKIIEEAISATVFSRAKELNMYRNVQHVDYDLLKLIRRFVAGFEVSRVPLWQWEKAIIEGYKAFRQLSEYGGGVVTLDIGRRSLVYARSSY